MNLSINDKRVLKCLARGQHRFYSLNPKNLLELGLITVKDKEVFLTPQGEALTHELKLTRVKNNEYLTNDLPVIKDMIADELFPLNQGELILQKPYAELWLLPPQLHKNLKKAGFPSFSQFAWHKRKPWLNYSTTLVHNKTKKSFTLDGFYCISKAKVYHQPTLEKLFDILNWDAKHIVPVVDIFPLSQFKRAAKTRK